ncbi:hypothetical protein [Luteococcus japonicus]|nr:hypothetical protein [Luteococcus japonicus]
MTVLLLVGLYTALAPKQYMTEAQDYFTVAGGGTDSDMYQGSIYVSSQMGSYRSLAASPLILDPVIKELGLDMQSEDLAGKLAITSPEDTSIVIIQAHDTDPKRAQDICNSVAKHLAQAAVDLSPRRASGKHMADAQVLMPAALPTVASAPNPYNNAIMGIAAALAAGLAAALLRGLLDPKIRTSRQLVRSRDTGALLAVLPKDDAVQGGGRFDPSHSVALEQLPANFLQGRIDDDRRPIAVVTSGDRGEGKTTVSLELARGLAASGLSVALVDAAVNSGGLGEKLGVKSGAPGLSEVLAGSIPLPKALHRPQAEPGLSVLPVGSGGLPAVAMIGSAAMRRLLVELGGTYDAIVIDTPGLGESTLAKTLSDLATDAIVVATPQTTREELAAVMERIQAHDGLAVSKVLNKASASDPAQGLEGRHASVTPLELPPRARFGS